jgi:fucose 4-O-acetylase-like acetyltransferase
MAAEKQRLIWIDIAKSLAIILVVLGHVWRGLEEGALINDSNTFMTLDHAIYYFHMPVFFMISGYLFAMTYARSWGSTLKKQLIFIIWPYILWSAVIVTMKVVLSSSVNSESSFSQLLSIHYQPVSIFWFLYALLVFQVVTKIMPNKLALLGLASAGVIAHYLYPVEGFDIINSITQFFIFFVLGFCFFKSSWQEYIQSPSKVVILSGTIVFAAVQYLFFLEGVSLSSPWAFLAAVTLSLSFFTICIFLSGFRLFQSSIFKYIGSATLAIYVSHVIFTAGARIVLSKLGVDDLTVHVIAGTALGVIAPLLMYEISQRLRLTQLAGLGALRRRV